MPGTATAVFVNAAAFRAGLSLTTGFEVKMMFDWKLHFKWFDDGNDLVPCMSGGLFGITSLGCNFTTNRFFPKIAAQQSSQKTVVPFVMTPEEAPFSHVEQHAVWARIETPIEGSE